MIVDYQGTNTAPELFKTADAEQAKATGGMIALLPATQYAEQLVVPDGEPLEDLHLTMVYLGSDVTGMDPTELLSQCDYISDNYGPIETEVFGYAAFNPADPEDGCAVYMVQGTPDLAQLQRDLRTFAEERFPGCSEQHPVWIPHVTAKYGLPVALSYQGPVVFDRLQLAFGGQDFTFSL